jgi:hypothetical protein
VKALSQVRKIDFQKDEVCLEANRIFLGIKIECMRGRSTGKLIQCRDIAVLVEISSAAISLTARIILSTFIILLFSLGQVSQLSREFKHFAMAMACGINTALKMWPLPKLMPRILN